MKCCVELHYGNTVRVKVTDLRDKETGDLIDDANLAVTLLDLEAAPLEGTITWPLALTPQGNGRYLAVFDLPDVTGATVGLPVQVLIESVEPGRYFRESKFTTITERMIQCA